MQQLLPIFTDIETTTITNQEEQIIKMVSGIVIFSRNLQWQETGELDLEHIQKLCHQIRVINPDITIAIDQEGGAVQRLCNNLVIPNSNYNQLPTAATIGRQYLKLKNQNKKEEANKLAFERGRILGKQVTAAGFDLNFNPVLDTHSDISEIIGSKERAFTNCPTTNTEICSQIIAGMNAEGVQGCLKHWPDHGIVHADSHQELAKDPRSIEEILHSDIHQQYQKLAAHTPIMLSHITLANPPPADGKGKNLPLKTLQDGNPLPVSADPNVIKQLKEIFSESKLITDCISMRGCWNQDWQQHPSPTAAWKSHLKRFLDSGADIIIATHMTAATMYWDGPGLTQEEKNRLFANLKK